MVYLAIVLALLVGFIIGYFSKGIDINVSSKPDIPEDVPMNKVNTDAVPYEMKQAVENQKY